MFRSDLLAIKHQNAETKYTYICQKVRLWSIILSFTQELDEGLEEFLP